MYMEDFDMEVKRNNNNREISWETKKMPDVVKWSSGGTPKATVKEYYENGDIPWLIIGDLNDGIVNTSATKITELGLNNSSAKLVPAGTLLIAMYGSIGKLGITGMECCTNQAIAFAKEMYGVTTEYMFYYLSLMKSKLISLGKGGTQKNISLTVLNSIDVVVPPITEQQRIVDRIEELFSQLDSAVETLNKTKQQLAVYRQAVLKEAFEGNLTGCKTIKEVALKDLVAEKDGLRRGPFGSAIKKAFFVSEGFKVYEQGNAINNDPYRGNYYITQEKYNELKNFEIKPHDLLVSCSGVTLGRIVELPNDAKPGVINQALLRVRLNHTIISTRYFIEYFRSELFQRMIFDKSQGSAMPNLVGIKEFKNIMLLVPKTIDDQLMIVREIDKRISVCDNIEKTVDTALQQAEAMRQSILKKAFEGKL